MYEWTRWCFEAPRRVLQDFFNYWNKKLNKNLIIGWLSILITVLNNIRMIKRSMNIVVNVVSKYCLSGRGWQLGFHRAKRRMIPRKSENVSKKRRWVEKVRICLQKMAWRQICTFLETYLIFSMSYVLPNFTWKCYQSRAPAAMFFQNVRWH